MWESFDPKNAQFSIDHPEAAGGASEGPQIPATSGVLVTDLGMQIFSYLQSDSWADPARRPATDASDAGALVRPESDVGLTLSETPATRKPVSRGRRPKLVVAVLAVITVASVDVLLAQDGVPHWFPAHAHELLAALPLRLAALALLVNHMVRRAALRELPKTLVLVGGFLFWSANQLWPRSSRAPIFNDIAIALFALDVVLVILGRSPGIPTKSQPPTAPPGPTATR